jgi:hypothetical protein
MPGITQSRGAGPPPPPELDLPTVAEGPMRGELRRQIERLEREILRLRAIVAPWEPPGPSRSRGPALLGSAALESIRDELVEVLAALRRRFESLR